MDSQHEPGEEKSLGKPGRGGKIRIAPRKVQIPRSGEDPQDLPDRKPLGHLGQRTNPIAPRVPFEEPLKTVTKGRSQKRRAPSKKPKKHGGFSSLLSSSRDQWARTIESLKSIWKEVCNELHSLQRRLRERKNPVIFKKSRRSRAKRIIDFFKSPTRGRRRILRWIILPLTILLTFAAIFVVFKFL